MRVSTQLIASENQKVRTYMEQVYEAYRLQFYAEPYSDFMAYLERAVQFENCSANVAHAYSYNELQQLGNACVPERDLEFEKIEDLKSCISFHQQRFIQLPQYQWMIQAMTYMHTESENRIEKTLEAYWVLSHLYVTLPTIEESMPIHPVHSIETVYWIKRREKSQVPFQLLVHDLFLQQVQNCGEWYVVDEQVARLKGLWNDQQFDRSYERAIHATDVPHIQLSAIGYMKEILQRQMQASKSTVFFQQLVQQKSSFIHIDRLPSLQLLERVVSIHTILLEKCHEPKIDRCFSGWTAFFEKQAINPFSPSATEAIVEAYRTVANQFEDNETSIQYEAAVSMPQRHALQSSQRRAIYFERAAAIQRATRVKVHSEITINPTEVEAMDVLNLQMMARANGLASLSFVVANHKK